MTRKTCFEPVVDQHVRVLVLGSLPGEQSLAKNEYYGNQKNAFWRLMSDVIGVDLPALEYADRLKALLRNHIGLWDVIAQAQRKGSLDSNISDHVDNDLNSLIATLPALRVIAFNGGTAAKLGQKILGQGESRCEAVRLPSSSPAYTRPYTEKLEAWRALQQWLQ